MFGVEGGELSGKDAFGVAIARLGRHSLVSCGLARLVAVWRRVVAIGSWHSASCRTTAILLCHMRTIRVLWSTRRQGFGDRQTSRRFSGDSVVGKTVGKALGAARSGVAFAPLSGGARNSRSTGLPSEVVRPVTYPSGQFGSSSGRGSRLMLDLSEPREN